MPRKTRDPVLTALLDEREKTIAAYAKCYSRLKKTFTRMDKLKQKLARLARKIEEAQAPKEKP